MNKNEIVLFVDNNIKLEVPVSPDQDTVWLSLDQMAELFDKDRSVIGRHVRNIFNEGELIEETSGQIMPRSEELNHRPAKPKSRDKRVAIYARVSSNSVEQLNSLTSQISGLTRLTAANPTWLLVDTYIDIASSQTGSQRKEFNRLVDNCIANKIDIVITKNVSRFGRDSLEILSTLEKLRETNIRVIFETEEIDTKKTDSLLLVSIIEAFAQAENETRSANIKWGNKQRAANGTSKLYDRKCYGYTNDKDGNLIIDDEKAEVVKWIFDWYMQGDSVGVIIKKLKEQGVRKSTGKDTWSKRTIETMLSNEKYTSDVILVKKGLHSESYMSKDNHQSIISEEMFKAVQIEKGRRSNVIVTEDGVKTKSTKYSVKKDR